MRITMTQFEEQIAARVRSNFAGAARWPQALDRGLLYSLLVRRQFHSDSIREALAELARCGRRHSRYAPLGFRWTRAARLAPDLAERRVMAKIVEWREAGYSWYEVASHLLRLGVRTRAGSEWSVGRCRRAYEAAIRLQEAGALG